MKNIGRSLPQKLYVFFFYTYFLFWILVKAFVGNKLASKKENLGTPAHDHPTIHFNIIARHSIRK